MKPFEDHLDNLSKQRPLDSFSKEAAKIIYEMLKYELDGVSSFIQSIHKAMQPILDEDKPVEKIEMNFETFKLFRNERKDEMEPITDVKTLKTGKYGSIWGVNIYINKTLKFREIKAFTEARFENVN